MSASYLNKAGSYRWVILIKKPLFIVLAIAVAIGAGIAFFTTNNLDGLIAEEIEAQGTAALGTTVTVGNVITSLRNGTVTVRGLNVENPKGYEHKNAVEISSFTASVDYATREIGEITIDQPIFNAELIGGKSNFQQLMNNLPDLEDDDSASTDDDTVITIRKFLLSKAQLNLTARDLKLDNRRFTMDDLAVNNLRGTPEQIANQLSRRLNRHVNSQIKSYAGQVLRSNITKELKAEASELGNRLLDKLKGN